jgi:hypothetical protein|nr:MAG TPA: hypothetical protein [Caudoviricetes sp.]
MINGVFIIIILIGLNEMTNVGKYAIFNEEKGFAGKIIMESDKVYVISVPTRLNGKQTYIEPKENCKLLTLEKTNETSKN